MPKQHRTGIRARHARTCSLSSGGTCSCRPSWEASVYSAREKKKLRKTFPTQAAARAWQGDAAVAVRRRTMVAPTRTTLRQAAEAWLAGARDGSIRTRAGAEYKPSALRGYEQALRLRVLPELGGVRLSALARNDVQDLADQLVSRGLDPSTIRNTLLPLRAILRRAVSRGEIALNPTTGIELPAVRGRRERIATPEEAASLIAVLRSGDRAVWATAMYAGLRLGELRAIRWEDVDLATGVIKVERSWDSKDGLIEPKSQAGRRKVPVPAVLRDFLVEHRQITKRSERLAFGRNSDTPFSPSSLRARALAAWKKAELEPITLHEARHTFASLMIAAGVNAKALSTYMGHSSVMITYDRYGHLMPGNEVEAAGLLDAYLVRADTAARLTQVQ